VFLPLYNIQKKIASENKIGEGEAEETARR